MCAITVDRPHSLNLLWHLLEGSDYTHIIAFGADTPLLAAPIFAQWLSIPLITILRGNDFDIGLFSRKKQSILTSCLEHSNAIGAVTQEKVQKLRLMYPNTSIIHTQNSINLDLWKALPSHQKLFHRPSSQLTIGLIGHLKIKKGVGFFIDTIHKNGLSEQIHFHIVGELDLETEDYLTSIEENISLTRVPPVSYSQLPAQYLSCDYLAIPSFYDGMPNVLLEAGGLGVPIIASRAGGIPDVVEDETHGFLFQVNNELSCLRAVQKALATHDGEQAQQGYSLQQHILENYTLENEKNQILKLLS